MVFNLVAVAGAFDHLHRGHEKLLQTAKKNGKKVIVGLCRPTMLKNKPYPQSIESYKTRRLALAKFLPDQIIPLSDIYGPADTSTAIEAIICSPLTRKNVEVINRRRRANNLKPLTIIEVPLVKCSNGQTLSSSLIRQGLTDRLGFYSPQLFQRDLKLPESLRPILQKPMAQPVKKIAVPKHGLITVGDIATKELIKENITPSLAIVDLRTRRQQIFPNLEALGVKPGLTANNPAGTITRNLVEKLLLCFEQKQPSLLVHGEEDLAVLPAILLAPLKTTIVYGQPDQGMVKIIVTEAAKAKTRKLLEQFT
jgi:hypothetical protein